MTVFIFTFLFGHFFAAIFLYLMHRFVFHGFLKRWPLLRTLAKLHGYHHAKVDDIKYMIAPFWAKISLALVLLLFGYFIHIGFSLGIASFGILYMFRHWSIHQSEKKTRFYYHHMFHHYNVKTNFSGIYPFIDKIFNTYEETRPELKPNQTRK